MRYFREHPLRVLGGLLLLAFVLFNLSGIPTLRYAKHGWAVWVGNVTWAGFCLAALAFLVLGVVALVRAAARRRSIA